MKLRRPSAGKNFDGRRNKKQIAENEKLVDIPPYGRNLFIWDVGVDARTGAPSASPK
jgi:hypothetical protein